MKNRLGLTMILGVFGVSCALAACGDDDDGVGSTDNGGAGGDASPTAGTKTGGSSSGGVAGKGGNTSGGKAGGGSGGSAGSTTTVGGAGGEGGTVEAGGAAGATNGGASGGADGGDGSGGAAPLEYSCGQANINQKLCSALLGANCPDQMDTCLDCVPQRTSERSLFTSCPACLTQFDKAYQCAIDAYETGDINTPTSGIECLPEYGADLSFDNCYPIFDSANDCKSVEAQDGCPATWP
jgi:hypothetical protein